ncbi:hypothetical protein IE3_03152 [Bacillus cereus BAG3X2-1]|nr:hypothetical protein IE3_03152 [Bacillus cereus BAG3X2-1]
MEELYNKYYKSKYEVMDGVDKIIFEKTIQSYHSFKYLYSVFD